MAQNCGFGGVEDDAAERFAWTEDFNSQSNIDEDTSAKTSMYQLTSQIHSRDIDLHSSMKSSKSYDNLSSNWNSSTNKSISPEKQRLQDYESCNNNFKDILDNSETMPSRSSIFNLINKDDKYGNQSSSSSQHDPTRIRETMITDNIDKKISLFDSSCANNQLVRNYKTWTKDRKKSELEAGMMKCSNENFALEFAGRGKSFRNLNCTISDPLIGDAVIKSQILTKPVQKLETNPECNTSQSRYGIISHLMTLRKLKKDILLCFESMAQNGELHISKVPSALLQLGVLSPYLLEKSNIIQSETEMIDSSHITQNTNTMKDLDNNSYSRSDVVAVSKPAARDLINQNVIAIKSSSAEHAILDSDTTVNSSIGIISQEQGSIQKKQAITESRRLISALSQTTLNWIDRFCKLLNLESADSELIKFKTFYRHVIVLKSPLLLRAIKLYHSQQKPYQKCCKCQSKKRQKNNQRLVRKHSHGTANRDQYYLMRLLREAQSLPILFSFEKIQRLKVPPANKVNVFHQPFDSTFFSLTKHLSKYAFSPHSIPQNVQQKAVRDKFMTCFDVELSFKPEISELTQKMSRHMNRRQRFQNLYSTGCNAKRRLDEMRLRYYEHELDECTFRPVIHSQNSRRSTNGRFETLYRLGTSRMKQRRIAQREPLVLEHVHDSLVQCTLPSVPKDVKATLNFPQGYFSSIARFKRGRNMAAEKERVHLQLSRLFVQSYDKRLAKAQARLQHGLRCDSKTFVRIGELNNDSEDWVCNSFRRKEAALQHLREMAIYVKVEVGVAKTVNIAIRKSDDAVALAHKFATIYGLNKIKTNNLAEILVRYSKEFQNQHASIEAEHSLVSQSSKAKTY